MTAGHAAAEVRWVLPAQRQTHAATSPDDERCWPVGLERTAEVIQELPPAVLFITAQQSHSKRMCMLMTSSLH